MLHNYILHLPSHLSGDNELKPDLCHNSVLLELYISWWCLDIPNTEILSVASSKLPCCAQYISQANSVTSNRYNRYYFPDPYCLSLTTEPIYLCLWHINIYVCIRIDFADEKEVLRQNYISRSIKAKCTPFQNNTAKHLTHHWMIHLKPSGNPLNILHE